MPLPDTPDHAAALRVFNAHLDLAKRVAAAMQRRMPPLARRADTQPIAMGALWESALKYHRLPPNQFAAVASVRIRGAILDDNRRYDILPRSNRRRFDGERLKLVHLDAFWHGTRLRHASERQGPPDFAEDLLAPHATTLDPEDIDRERALVRFYLAVDALPERERFIVRAILDGTTQLAIGKTLGVSEPRVNQILSRSVKQLRRALMKPLTANEVRAEISRLPSEHRATAMRLLNSAWNEGVSAGLAKMPRSSCPFVVDEPPVEAPKRRK